MVIEHNIQCPVDLLPQMGFTVSVLIKLRIYPQGQNKHLFLLFLCSRMTTNKSEFWLISYTVKLVAGKSDCSQMSTFLKVKIFSVSARRSHITKRCSRQRLFSTVTPCHIHSFPMERIDKRCWRLEEKTTTLLCWHRLAVQTERNTNFGCYVISFWPTGASLGNKSHRT